MVPSFSNSVGQFRLPFPNEKRVQKPLQEVYRKFIDAHLRLIEGFTKRDPGELIPPFRSETVALIDLMQHPTGTLRKKRRCKKI